jgi:putative membrane protein
MNKQIIKILGNIIAIYLGTFFFTEISVSSTATIVIAGFVLWIVNIIIRPLLILITIPVNLLTLGLFSLVINTWMVMLVGKLIEGFTIRGFWTAFFIALLVSFVNAILEKVLKNK